MSNKNNRNNFLIHGSILAIASIISRMIGLIYRVPLERIIGEVGTGYYTASFEMYSILLIISSYSLPLAVSKLVSVRVANKEYKNAQYIFKHALIFAVGIGLIAAAVDFFGAGLFAKISKYYGARLAIQTLAPTLFILAVLGVFRGYFQGIGTMIPTATSNIIEQIINAIVSVGAAWYLFHLGLDSGKEYAYGAAGGTIGTGAGALAALLFMLFLYCIYRKVIVKRVNRDVNSAKNPVDNIYGMLIITILPVIFNTAVYNISGFLDGQIFSNVEFYKGVEEIQYTGLYGVYSLRYRTLVNVPIAIASALASAIVPVLAENMARNRIRDVKRKIEYSIRFSMIIAIPCAVGMAVLANPIIALIFEPDKTAGHMMQVGAISVVFYSLSTITNSVLQGIDKMKVPVLHAGISVIVHIILLVTLLAGFHMSVDALVYADTFFALLICILNSAAIKRYLGYRQEVTRTFILPAVCAAIMGAAAYFTHYLVYSISQSNILSVALAVILAVIVYGISIVVLHVVDEEELLSVPKGAFLVKIFKKCHLM